MDRRRTPEVDEPTWSRKCACGKVYYQPNSYTYHITNCSRYKTDVARHLEDGKTRYQEKKLKQSTARATARAWYANEGDLDIDATPDRDSANPHASGGSHQPELAQPPVTLEEPADDELLGRGHRLHQPIRRYADFEATSTVPFNIPLHVYQPPEAQSATTEEPSQLEHRLSIHNEGSWKQTAKNDFGLYKRYWTLEGNPRDPDYHLSPGDLRDYVDAIEPNETGSFYPFPNLNAFRLGEWYWSDEDGKSRDSFQKLLDIISHQDFDPQDIREAKWDKINTILASSEFEDEDTPWSEDGASWTSASISVDVPFNSTSVSPGVLPYTIPNYRYRPLVPLITEKLQDSQRGDFFHIVPSDLRWKPGPNAEDVRVYGELYNSPAFLEEYKIIQSLPSLQMGCSLPRYIVALMFASDETMLASFGNAKLWPLYMSFGNESKYRRGKPSLKLVEEIAYFQSLPDHFSDWYISQSGKKSVGNPLRTHLNRELFQAQWKVLLDDQFVKAYQEGIVVKSIDGVTRRFYPRIFTYSADYPEKVIVVGVRNLGDYPCPRCLIPLTEIHQMGTPSDRAGRVALRRVDNDARKKKIQTARKHIYIRHYNVNSNPVEEVLKPTSLVPAQNAFSDSLSDAGLDLYRLISVDILHEVEIGVWKSLYTQLLRLLETLDAASISQLDFRYRQVPTFGKDTIRRFCNNVSEMKQLAARDYEDMLQCAFPVFEGLFSDSHSNRIQNLLFALAHWHSLAKLRMHTDHTLATLDEWTVILGEDSRIFVSETCNSVETRELKREFETRKRAEARKKSSGRPQGDKEKPARKAGARAPDNVPGSSEAGLGSASGSLLSPPPEGEHKTGISERKLRTWNLNTPKFHGLGDVAQYIRLFGTTDSYSTQTSERFHRFSKARYRRTNKKQVSMQLSRVAARQARIRKLRKQMIPAPHEGTPSHSEFPTRINKYFIGKSQNSPVKLAHFLKVNAIDPAVRKFMLKMKYHLLPRIIAALLREARLEPEHYSAALPILESLSTRTSFSENETNGIYFHSDRIYRHKILKINYTTYDCRQDQDTLNPSTSKRDFMCLRAVDNLNSPGEDTVHDNKFLYGRLLGIFHANVIYGGPGMLDHRARKFDFLWVRWYESKALIVPWIAKRLDRISFLPLSQLGACGFMDPSDVLRGAHIIPRFSLGKVHDEHNPQRIFSKSARDRHDWNEYYVNRFVDRDMMMRFHWGLGVGHTYSHGSAPTSSSDNAMDVDVDDPQAIAGSQAFEADHPDDPSMDRTGENETDSNDSAYDTLEDREGGDSDPDWEPLEQGKLLGTPGGDVPDEQEPDSSDSGSEIYE